MSDMLQPAIYEKRFTLFRRSHFDTPVVYPIARMQLPRQSIFHFVTTDAVRLGPRMNDELLRVVPGIVYVDNVSKMENAIGGPIPKPGANPNTLLTEYRRLNRQIRPLKNMVRLEDDTRSLVCINYAFLPHLVRYPISFRASYFEWYNVYSQVYKKINEIAPDSKRSHFIEIDLPAIMPALTVLREFAANPAPSNLKKLNSPELKMLADLFVWAGKHREKSLLSKLSPELYSKVNFIVRRNDSWVAINLGWLDGFRAGEGKKGGMDPTLFELRVLKLMSIMHQAAAPVASAIAEEVVAEPEVNEDTIHEDPEATIKAMDAEDDALISGNDDTDAEQMKRLEDELNELDKLKDAESGVESTNEDDELVKSNTSLDINMLSQVAETPKEGEAIRNKADELASKGVLSVAEHRRLFRVSDSFKSLTNPYNSSQSLEEAMTMTEADVIVEPDVLTDDAVVVDKSLTLSRVDAMERQYIQKVMKKDILRVVMSMQRAPVAITDYRIEEEKDAMNDREIHTVRFVPAVGKPSTVKFSIPRLRDDGTFLYNGTSYRMRKQRADLPFRKIGPTRVALTSYYAKVFVDRSARKRFDYSAWVLNIIKDKCQNPADPDIKNAVISKCVDYKIQVPTIYTTLATEISYFDIGQNKFGFDYKHRVQKFGFTESDLKLEKKGWVLVGRNRKGALIMDPEEVIYQVADGHVGEDLGKLEMMLGIEVDKAPITMAEVKIYSKSIPIGVALAYMMGLEGLLSLLKLKPRRVGAGERLQLRPNEYAIRFKNESLIFDRTDRVASLIMGGFSLYHAHIREYNIGLFDEKDVYAAVLERAGIGRRYLNELDMMNTLFIDPITEDILKWMNEPTTFTGLLFRAVSLLTDEYVPSRRKDKDQQVESLERVRGYERVAGNIYETLSRSVRAYSARAATGNSSIVVNPNEIMNEIIKDPTTAPVNNINPIHQLREREVITFGGKGGRSRRAMTAKARLFTDEDMGFISEGSVDSGDVGIITYLSPNSNITSVRGTVRLFDKKRDGAASIMSTAALLSPAADGDDPKRVNFITVQHGHGIQAVGYETQGIRTGMERALVSRMGPEFASTASDTGKVIELSDTHIAVEYKDSVVRYPIGLVHTTAEGSYYPNQLVSKFKEGDTVKKFDVITYNTGFFKESPFDKHRVDYMVGCLGRIALREATYTVEDSSSLSVAFAERMGTVVSKPKSISINYEQNISGLLKVGDSVDLDTILCTIEDDLVGDASLFDDDTRETLRRWTDKSPRAAVVGTIAKIEVFYNGGYEDMSESLQIIVSESEKRRRREAKRLGHTYTTGEVDRNVRIDGYNLEEHQALIRIYISNPVGMGVGDKLVVGNQGKSTVGEILFGDNRTVEGEVIDMIFGCKSFIDRIITSPFIIGTTNTTLRYIGELAYEMYFGSDE